MSFSSSVKRPSRMLTMPVSIGYNIDLFTSNICYLSSGNNSPMDPNVSIFLEIPDIFTGISNHSLSNFYIIIIFDLFLKLLLAS